MNRYATVTPEARLLISELEFVWDQIKDLPLRADETSPASSAEEFSPSQTFNRNLQRSSGASASASNSVFLPRDTTRGGLHTLLTHPPIARGQQMFQSASMSQLQQPFEYTNHEISGEDYFAYEDSELTAAKESDAALAEQKRRLRRMQHEQWTKQVERALQALRAEVAALREEMDEKYATAEPMNSRRISLPWAQSSGRSSWTRTFFFSIARIISISAKVITLFIYLRLSSQFVLKHLTIDVTILFMLWWWMAKVQHDGRAVYLGQLLSQQLRSVRRKIPWHVAE